MNKMEKWMAVVLCMLMLSGTLRAQKLQISTNAVGWACLGTMNLEVDYAVAQHWSVGVSGRYNPFSFGDMSKGENQFQLRQRCVAMQARWWPWHIYSGWWVAGKAQWQEYNTGGILSAETEEGQRYGGGLTAGYSYMVNKHFNVEMGLGFWGGMKQYVKYACPTCGQKVNEGVKAFVMPNDIIVSLAYVF